MVDAIAGPDGSVRLLAQGTGTNLDPFELVSLDAGGQVQHGAPLGTTGLPSLPMYYGAAAFDGDQVLVSGEYTTHGLPTSPLWSQTILRYSAEGASPKPVLDFYDGSPTLTDRSSRASNLAATGDGGVFLVGAARDGARIGVCEVHTTFSPDPYVAKFDAGGACLWAHALGVPPAGGYYAGLQLVKGSDGAITLAFFDAMTSSHLHVVHSGADGALAWSVDAGGVLGAMVLGAASGGDIWLTTQQPAPDGHAPTVTRLAGADGSKLQTFTVGEDVFWTALTAVLDDGAGGVYVGGVTNGEPLVRTDGPATYDSRGFVAHLDSTGAAKWAAFCAGIESSPPRRIALGGDGTLVVSGTEGSAPASTGTYVTSFTLPR